MKPGVVAKLRTLAQILFEPLLGRVLYKMLDRKNLAVDLRVRLHRVAPIDEERCTVGQDHRRACRAGESRQPGKPFLARGQIFILLSVGARHHKTVEAVALEFVAQFGNACALCARSLESSND